MKCSVFAFFVGLVLVPGLAFAQAAPPGMIVQEQAPLVRGRIIALGIPQASAVAEVGVFHPGGPIHDKPEFIEYTKPGNILDPKRILITSASNFGAPRAHSGDSEGAVLSLDASDPAVIEVPPDFAAAGDQASALNGRVKLFSAQSPRFLNGVNTPGAATADQPAVSNPLGISINNAFGRLWFPSAPAGSHGPGLDSIVDPGGEPLAGAPSKLAGGLFAGDLTNRQPQLIAGGLRSGAIGNAFLGASPDGSKRAVFAVLTADGAIAQAHSELNLDGLAPTGTIAPIELSAGDAGGPGPTRAGIILNWAPDRILYVTDPARDAIVVLTLGDNGKVFQVKDSRRISSPRLHMPVDIAPAISEIGNPGFASNTTLAAGSDFYVLNRGDGTIVRMRQDGSIVAARTVASANGEPLGPGQLNGIAVSRDATKLWITISGALPGYPQRPGAVLELPAFGPGRATSLPPLPMTTANEIERGTQLFSASFTPATGLGPLFNGPSCISCHSAPRAGGMGTDGLAPVLRVGRVDAGAFDPLIGSGGPVARAHSIAEFGIKCSLLPGIPPQANLVSLRNAPALFGAGLIDAIPESTIWPDEGGGVVGNTGRSGKPNRIVDAQGREHIGRFGWKADIASLEEFVALAFRNELGVTNPMAPSDLVSVPDHDCGIWQKAVLKDDGQIVSAVTAFIASLSAPVARVRPDDAAGRELFGRIGCATCHTPELRTSRNEVVALYSDLLLHDMGARLNDGVVQGQASGADWRTTPLWGLGGRNRFLHDGSVTTVTAAVLAHDGEAAASVKDFMQLSPEDRTALLDFLERL